MSAVGSSVHGVHCGAAGGGTSGEGGGGSCGEGGGATGGAEGGRKQHESPAYPAPAK